MLKPPVYDMDSFMKQTGRHLASSDVLALCRDDGPLVTAAPPNVSLYRRDAPSPLESHLYEPVLCYVLNGAKVMRSGDIEVEISAGEALVVSHHLPVLSQITEAPYRAIVLTLSAPLIREIVGQIDDLPNDPLREGAISCMPHDRAWLAPLERYLSLALDRQALKVLGPSVLREIHYRLLMSPIGAILRNFVFSDSHASRIARAINAIREDVAAPLKVATLAGKVGMSTSAFHSHFKSVTGTTPLQYQKDLRLITSRDLMTRGAGSVASTAFAVGYESPTHFSRDYKRKFGESPSARLREAFC